ncbi:MAG: hypothetical protein GEV28_02725 [Actinophytocola sp.]|uniref:hypothetical protein n=1 Tax=Actinophytocola sp. TaxID=1872138 RepID=UPI00132BB54C|nr:hypothetical protein [Actinophytocola sp.]MPZ79350.1 hypothetical protein [Actinophytocola sp.]
MTDTNEDPGTNQDPPEKPASRRGAVVAIVAAVVVLAVVGLVVYLLVKPGDDDNADPNLPTITGSAPPSSEAPTPEPGGEQPGPLTTPPPPADENVAAARTVAEEAAAAIESRDVSAMEELACDPSAVGTVEEFPPEATARLVENPQITGDKATAQVELTIAGSEPTVVPLPLEKRGGKWCVP